MNDKINYQDYIFCKKINKLSFSGESVYNLYTLYHDKSVRQDIVCGTKEKIMRWVKKNFPNYNTNKTIIDFLSVGDSICLIGIKDGHETYKTYDNKL